MTDPSATVPAFAPGRRRLIVVMLRWIGLVSLSALAAVVMPHTWMDYLHRAIGLGELPETPVVSYLSRSLSLFYAWLGAIFLFLSFDIERYIRLIRFLSIAGLAVAIIQTGIDVVSALPLWWIITESGFLFLFFGFLTRLARR